MGSATDKVGAYGQTNDSDMNNNSADRNVDELRFDIQSTRSEMSETVDAIQAKLSPQSVQETAEQITERAKKAALEVAELTTERVKQAALDVSEQVTERVKETVTQLKNEVKSEIHDATIGRIERMVNNVRETTNGTSATVMELIKANPIPAALVGIGMAWLFMNKSNHSSQGGHFYPQNQGQMWNNSQNPSFSNTVQQKADQVKNTVSETADNIKEKAEGFVSQAQDQVEHLSDQVQDQAQRVMSRSQSMLDDNPLITSALALTVGAAVGFLLPETRREDEWMGETRNKLLNQVSEVAHNTMEKAQKVATEVIQTTGEKVQEATNSEQRTPNKQ